MQDEYEPSRPLSPSSVTLLDGSSSTESKSKDEEAIIKNICLAPNKVKVEPKSDNEDEDTVDIELSAIGVIEKSDLKKDLSFVAEYANGNCTSGKVISLVDKKPSTSTKLHILTLLDKDVDTYRRLMIRGVDMGDLLNPVLYTLINSADKMVFEGNNVNKKTSIKAGILILYFADILDRFTYLRRYLLNFEIPDRHLEIICTYPNDELPVNLIESWKNSHKEEPPPCLSTNTERLLLARQLVLKDIPLTIVSSDLVSAYKNAKKIDFMHDYNNVRCAVFTFPDIISCHVSHVIQRTVKIKDKYIASYLMSEMLPNSKLKPIKLKDETDEEAHTRITFNALWQSLISSVEEIKASKHAPASEKKQEGSENESESMKRKMTSEETSESDGAKRSKGQETPANTVSNKEDTVKSRDSEVASAVSAPKAGSTPISGTVSAKNSPSTKKPEAQKTTSSPPRQVPKLFNSPKNSLNLRNPGGSPITTSTTTKPALVKPTAEPFKRSTLRFPAISNTKNYNKSAPYKNTGPAKKPAYGSSSMKPAANRRPKIASLMDLDIPAPVERQQPQSSEWGNTGARMFLDDAPTPTSVLSSYEYNNMQMQDMSNLSEPDYLGGGFSSEQNFNSGNSTYELAQQIQMRLVQMRGAGESNFSQNLNNQSLVNPNFSSSGVGGGLGGRFYSNETAPINLDRMLGTSRPNVSSFLSGPSFDDYDFDTPRNQDINPVQNSFKFPGNPKYGRQYPSLDRRY